MICAIHQPNFLPWLGFFNKMTQADVFVLLDTADLSPGSFTNRVRVKSKQGPRWLTLPIDHSSKFRPIVDARIDTRLGWKDRVLGVLEECYREAPFYTSQIEAVRFALGVGEGELLSANVALLLYATRQLVTPAKTLLRASALNVDGVGTERLVNICKVVGADTYLSGQGGKNYLVPSQFEQAGIAVEWLDFKHPVYPQLYGEFVPAMSVIDLLLNCGAESASILRGETK